jgi:hypothetical protein
MHEKKSLRLLIKKIDHIGRTRIKIKYFIP